jgi:phosphatidylglycerophosphate synthase
MLRQGYAIYVATRKKNDQLFNHYFMRPIAGVAVALLAKTPITPNQVTIINLVLFLVAAVLFVVLDDYRGGLVAIAVLELSYMLDCADGMLARHKKLASKAGHHFDFFTDEVKAAALVVALGLRLDATDGWGPSLRDGAPTLEPWPDGWFVYATLVALFVITGGISMTKLLRHPDLSGKEEGVEAYYETVERPASRSLLMNAVQQGFTFLRFLNHYPSHIWLFALVARLDLFFFVYVGVNALNLGQGWLRLLVRFGRFPKKN